MVITYKLPTWEYKMQVRWSKHNNRKIFCNSILVSFSLSHTLTHVGDYVCQIGDSEEAKDQVHTVEILVPPSVRPVPQNGQITARKGSTVTLECRASGNPVPNIYFYKKVSSKIFITNFFLSRLKHLKFDSPFLILKHDCQIWFVIYNSINYFVLNPPFFARKLN